MIKQLDRSSWKGLTEIPCTLPRKFISIFEEKGFELAIDYYDIFEEIYLALFETENNHPIGIMMSINNEKFDIDILTSKDSPEADLLSFLNYFELDLDDLSWFSDQLDFSHLPCYELWRTDDNGNKFHIRNYRTLAKAKRMEKEFHEKGHKQVYWIESKLNAIH